MSEFLLDWFNDSVSVASKISATQSDEVLIIRIGWMVKRLRSDQVRSVLDMSCRSVAVSHQIHILVADHLEKTSPHRALLATAIFAEVRREQIPVERITIQTESEVYRGGRFYGNPHIKYVDEPTPNP
jgi:hypothetical protein